MLCRSCAAAFAQYLEDQGGFPLFTIEGDTVDKDSAACDVLNRSHNVLLSWLIKLYRAAQAPQVSLLVLCVSVRSSLARCFSHREVHGVAGNEPEVVKATWNLPVPASQQKELEKKQTASTDEGPAAATDDEIQADSSR